VGRDSSPAAGVHAGFGQILEDRARPKTSRGAANPGRLFWRSAPAKSRQAQAGGLCHKGSPSEMAKVLWPAEKPACSQYWLPHELVWIRQ